MDYYFAVLSKYADFSGRARRAEYWTFLLVNFLVTLVLAMVEKVTFNSSVGTGAGTVGLLAILYGLAVLLPGLAVTARRLHDTNRSGWWMLIFAIPIVGAIGAIVLIIFLIQDSDARPNRHGPNPKGELAPA